MRPYAFGRPYRLVRHSLPLRNVFLPFPRPGKHRCPRGRQTLGRRRGAAGRPVSQAAGSASALASPATAERRLLAAKMRRVSASKPGLSMGGDASSRVRGPGRMRCTSYTRTMNILR